ncbi:hypothetical protein T459_15248 [Capsicum annuum]|uniref:DYW domain-containing protein n=1 Tax=Capsicum annuum TaxID=4072 RepID=A0A2G2ZJR8_CAPAN|nr:hypothetical protein T459_15248 [Capsicum annuum]
MYCKCDLTKDARLIYALMPGKDLFALNAMISCYSQIEADDACLDLFIQTCTQGIGFDQKTLLAILNSAAGFQAASVCKQVPALSVKSGFQCDTFVVNSLVDSYGKCSQLDAAARIFDECPTPDLPSFYLSYNSLCSTRSSSLLNACANLSAYEQGKQLHAHVLKFGFTSDVFAGMVSWSAMIGGLAQHGHAKQALHLFDEMLKHGVSPNHITLVSVLYACNHADLVAEAKKYFETMKDSFWIEPTQEHYACMVDVLGRAGKLADAIELVNKIPFEADAFPCLEPGVYRKQPFYFSGDKSGTHVLRANIYVSFGLWEDVVEVRRFMKTSRVKKEPGMSWIKVKDSIYTFIVGDRNHPRSDEIYGKLEELGQLMAKAGYVPMIHFDLHDVERRQKEILLSYHSEKLAVAFGLIATPHGVPIRAKKNLRICLDCHTAFKLICKIVSGEIIIRDINWFHHFKDGSCSCGDYW